MKHLLVALLLSACGSVSPYPPGPPVPNDADAAEQCAAICDRLDVLGCESAQGNVGPDGVAGTDDDATCEHACVDVQTIIPLDADCIVAAGSCGAANACEAL